MIRIWQKSGMENRKREYRHMNPQETIEQILREIHVTFSEGEPVASSPGMVIVDQKKIADLLDQLNQAMDEWLQSGKSGNEAELAAKKRGEQMMEKAQTRAEDIYAASILYSDNMVGKLRSLLDEADDSVNDMIRGFRKELHRERNLLQNHETQLHAQLAELSDTGKYLKVIEQINHEKEQEDRSLEEERRRGKEFASQLKGSSSERIYIPPSAAKVRGSEESYETAKEQEPDDIIDFDLEEPEKTRPDIKVNKDAAYFQWKKEQEAAAAEASESGMLSDSEENNPVQESVLQEETREKSPEPFSDSGLERQDAVDEKADDHKTIEASEPSTGKLPNEDALMKAMLVGETSDVEAGAAIASPLEEDGHLVKEVQLSDIGFDWKDMDLSANEDPDDRMMLTENEDEEIRQDPHVRQKKKKGRFKDFLLGN